MSDDLSNFGPLNQYRQRHAIKGEAYRTYRVYCAGLVLRETVCMGQSFRHGLPVRARPVVYTTTARYPRGLVPVST